MTEGFGAGSSLSSFAMTWPVTSQNMGADITTRRFVSTYSFLRLTI